MTIHVVRPGETLPGIAAEYGVDAGRLAADNAVTQQGLAVGQTLVVRFPLQTHRVREGETLSGIASRHGLSVRALWRRNWPLGGRDSLYPGQTLVLSYRDERPLGNAVFNGYSYPHIGADLLDAQLPYLTYLTPFTYGINADGGLLELNDWSLRSAARRHGARTLLHLSTLTEDGTFNTARGALVLTDPVIQNRLIRDVLARAEETNSAGVDVDFEYLPEDLGPDYAEFLGRLRGELRTRRKFLWAALAPKVRANQPGILYEAHDYAAIGAAVDAVLLMTYEWGYTAGPPMAVAPLPNVRAVLNYAVTEMEPGQILLGIPNYGYDWALPFVRGVSRARSISNLRAVQLAMEYDIAIQFDETAQSPYFHYTDNFGTVHEVWFEDARSMSAKLRLIDSYGLRGGGVWNLMRPYSQIWLLADALYSID
ncbi:MAG: LysM peptidoglycan-binding domain-containing protein [Oscillibacter sp.]|nr:LysM peptidoglycan-binding domain-containing protein [Oscillibacter sp.]